MIILGTNSIKETGFNVANSLRFHSDTYLTATFGSAPTLATKNTFSMWFKRSSLGTLEQLYTGDTNAASIVINTNDTIAFYNSSGQLLGPRLYRDTSAWMHFVFAYDSTQGTDTNRFKVYINGVLETSFNNTAYPAQDAASDLGENGTDMKIGTNAANGRIFEGYIAETAFVDGQALDATSFGEFDEDSGIWKPIDISGLTFGNNGFYLEYKQSGTGTNSSGLGADTSGNDFHFAVTNFTAIDQSTDTCTNNFATYNPLMNKSSGVPTMSNGNLTLTTNLEEFGSVSSIGVSQGKWYCELKWDSGSYAMVGITGDPIILSTNSSAYAGITADSWSWHYGGTVYNNNSTIATYSTFATSDILGIALDLDNNKLYFSKNGTWENSGVPTSGATGTGAISITASASVSEGNYFIWVGNGSSSANATLSANFGNAPYSISSGNADGNGYGNFEYAVPANYYSLNSKNLSEFG